MTTITAEIIADSISENGTRITSFELVYPRIIHSELMTHRVFSRNSASSRAIPIKKMIETIRNDVAKPVHWGANRPGMQAKEECFNKINGYTADEWWDLACKSAIRFSEEMEAAGYHKQVANRLTEAFQHMKVVVTATSFDNWFWLRNHEDADPTIKLLAHTMLEAYKENKPRLLLPSEWHVPYFEEGYWSPHREGFDAKSQFFDSNNVPLEDALKISSSCCAQVSYRTLDDTLEKAKAIYERLVGSACVHASPFEHQATPMCMPFWTKEEYDKHDCSSDFQMKWEEGVTHMTSAGDFCSGNFKHWVQHRQLIPGHVCDKYDSF